MTDDDVGPDPPDLHPARAGRHRRHRVPLGAGRAGARDRPARPLAEPDTPAAIRDELPIHVTVGDADPVNAGRRYRAAGPAVVTTAVWPGARHEVFNETDRDEIVADLLTWLDRVVPPQRKD